MAVDPKELEKAIFQQCEKEYRGWLFGGGYKKAESRDKVGETLEQIEKEREQLMEKHEEYMKQAEIARSQAKFLLNPHMREIAKNLKIKYGSKGLVCPRCGEGDNGNRMNGKPWCMKCNLPLMTLEKTVDWVKPKKAKPQNFTFKEPDGVVKK